MNPLEYFEGRLTKQCGTKGKALLSLYRKWKTTFPREQSLLDHCQDDPFYTEKTGVQSTIGFLDKFFRIQACDIFVPSGYPTADRCKNCGVYISTLSGLNSLAQEAINSGKIDSAASERFLSERYLAEAHGVISLTQFPIEKIEEAMLCRIGQSQQQSLSSDISVDLDTDLGTVKKTSIKKDKSGYYPIKNPLLLNEGMRVFYNPSGKKDQKDIRQGTVLERRLIEGVGSSPTLKQGKKPSRKTGLAFRGKTYMFLIQSDSRRREHWIYSNQIWTEEPLIEDDEQASFFDQEESTDVDEYLDLDD